MVKFRTVDEGLCTLGQGDKSVRLSDVWKSPIFNGAPYSTIWQRVMYLSTLDKIEIERTDGHLYYKTRSNGDD
jgi:hypothetical protein